MKKKDYWLSHERRHTNEKPFECKKCDKWFKTKGELNIHLKYHNGDRSHACTLCHKTFTQSTHLLTHKRALHLTDQERRNYDCNVCNKTLKSKQSLDTHMVIHSDRKPFQCEVCPQAFKLKQHLKLHLKTQHTTSSAEFQCNLCQKVLSQARTLANHMKEVHEKSEIHRCALCDYTAPRKSTIQIHTDATHNNIKFECPRCSKKVAHKSTLTKHMRKCEE